ncbi:MAG: hypothetical protein ACR2PL_19660, partial [Dehalococcoidia bacterium]
MKHMRWLRIDQWLKQVTWFAAIVAASVVGTVLALRMLAPGKATAQAGQGQALRVSELLLIAPDGGTRARLGVDADGGGVSLRLYDGDGQTPRVNLGIAPQGPGMVIFGPDGRLPRVVLGTTPTGDNPGMASFDASGTARLVVGTAANGAGTMVFDSKGQLGVLDGVREGDIPG